MRNSPVTRTEFDLVAQKIKELERRILLQENQHTPTVPVYLSGFPDDSILAQLALAPASTCSWEQQDPGTVPDARGYAVAAYDQVRDEVVMFGGTTDTTYLADTWVYSVAADQWTLKTPVHAPSARVQHGMAWDDVSGGVLLFGGSLNSGQSNQTWIWDGTDWTQLTPAHAPSTRSGFAMAEAPGIGNVVLFGGIHNADVNPNAETWTWDGTDWTLLTPATSPIRRQLTYGAYDPVNDYVVMFGGVNGASSYSDTWTWDGATWTDVSPADPDDAPTVTNTHVMAYSNNCGHVVLFGGLPTATVNTWMWDPPIWVPRSSPTEPTKTDLGAFSESGGPIVLFGGFPASAGDETWRFG